MPLLFHMEQSKTQTRLIMAMWAVVIGLLVHFANFSFNLYYTLEHCTSLPGSTDGCLGIWERYFLITENSWFALVWIGLVFALLNAFRHARSK